MSETEFASGYRVIVTIFTCTFPVGKHLNNITGFDKKNQPILYLQLSIIWLYTNADKV